MAVHSMPLTLDENDAGVGAENAEPPSGFPPVAGHAEVVRTHRVTEGFEAIDRLSRQAEEAPAQEVGAGLPADDAAMDVYLDAIDAALGSRRSGPTGHAVRIQRRRTDKELR